MTALTWFKSSFSDDQGGACLEVALSPETIHVRDSKLADSPQLALTAGAWSALLDAQRPIAP
ncbi:DUF397 domain-containing protein [Yinghuangia seranimata]|uniref:DUF397 domain-containing protein n=1 Tax=Yinghuangia seranimata TaxID=408067 RepID=UPI00248C4539|nr:DUF397 domain-containing protein [Yinghuangia seranimata]MDI2129096.1 DUF397 domain-containing protein [Yinghuangia seranimata]